MQIIELSNYMAMCDSNIEYTQGTKDFYKKHLSIIDSWLFDNGIRYLKDITLKDVNTFVNESRLNCSETTINKRLGMIKRALKFNCIKTSEAAKILNLKKLKEIKRSYQMLTSQDYNKILKFVKCLPTNLPNYLLYKTFILLLIDTGARVGEILAIEKRNINLDTCEILLKKTKTKIERFVYFYDTDTKEAISEMLKLSKEKHLLWNDSKQRQMNYDDVRYIMKLIKQKAKIKNVYAYMFRHTFATRLIENGADVFAVKDLLGHEKLTTTQIYTHLSKKHIKKVYQISHKR